MARQVRVSRVPWQIEPSDLCEANGGDLELTRDVVINGQPQRHLAMHVIGQFVPSLGLIAIRCERRGGLLYPLTLSIPDTPPVNAVLPTDATQHGASRNARATSAADMEDD